MNEEALDRIIAEIKAELPRSLALHPPEEWAEMTFLAMRRDVMKELDEAHNAYIEGRMTGPHNCFMEINHAIIVLMRMRMELERREDAKIQC